MTTKASQNDVSFVTMGLIQHSMRCCTFAGACSTNAPITKQIMAARPFPPAKLSKTPTRVNPLALGVCGICRSGIADELEYIYRRELLGTHERMGHTSFIDYLMASSLCILILFGIYTPCLLIFSKTL